MRGSFTLINHANYSHESPRQLQQGQELELKMSKVVRVLISLNRIQQRSMELLVDWGVPQDPFHEGLYGHGELQTKGRRAQGTSSVASQPDSGLLPQV
jgi:hypothetical protein